MSFSLWCVQSAPFEKYIDCMPGHSYISLIILACYKLVLAIIGSVLAVQNRKINIPELREAKLVGLATYAFLFAIAVTVASIFAVQDTRVRAIVVSVEGLCIVTFLLAILFVPKVSIHKHLHSTVIAPILIYSMELNDYNMKTIGMCITLAFVIWYCTLHFCSACNSTLV